jgi:hypothetical protein
MTNYTVRNFSQVFLFSTLNSAVAVAGVDSKSELASIVAQNYAFATALTAEYEVKELSKHDSISDLIRYEVTFENSRIRCRERTIRTSDDGKIDDQPFADWCFDGDKTVTIVDVAKQANIGRNLEIEAQRWRTFDVLTINGLACDFEGLLGASSHVMILNSVNSFLRPALEQIGDVACSVIDLKNAISGDVIQTVWFDAERGGVALKKEFYWPSGLLAVRYEATTVQSLNDGSWMVTKAKKQAWNDEIGEYSAEIAVIDAGLSSVKISLNPSVASDLFELEVPSGYRVVDGGTITLQP